MRRKAVLILYAVISKINNYLLMLLSIPIKDFHCVILARTCRVDFSIDVILQYNACFSCDTITEKAMNWSEVILMKRSFFLFLKLQF